MIHLRTRYWYWLICKPKFRPTVERVSGDVIDIVLSCDWFGDHATFQAKNVHLNIIFWRYKCKFADLTVKPCTMRALYVS